MLYTAENEMNLDMVGTTPQYYLFQAYHAAMKNFLKSTLYLDRFPRDKNINVYWSTPSRAWAKYVQPLANGFPNAPVVTFNLGSAEMNMKEAMGGWPWMIEEFDNRLWKTHTPAIWELTYTVTLWTGTISDMEKLIYQLLLYTMPPKTWAGKLDGKVWYQIDLKGGITFQDELEPGSTKDKLIRRELTFRIPRAYVPRESIEIFRIKDIEAKIEFDVNNEEVAYPIEISSPV